MAKRTALGPAPDAASLRPSRELLGVLCDIHPPDSRYLLTVSPDRTRVTRLDASDQGIVIDASAFRQLQAEGLVTLRPGPGWQVAEISARGRAEFERMAGHA